MCGCHVHNSPCDRLLPRRFGQRLAAPAAGAHRASPPFQPHFRCRTHYTRSYCALRAGVATCWRRRCMRALARHAGGWLPGWREQTAATRCAAPATKPVGNICGRAAFRFLPAEGTRHALLTPPLTVPDNRLCASTATVRTATALCCELGANYCRVADHRSFSRLPGSACHLDLCLSKISLRITARQEDRRHRFAC